MADRADETSILIGAKSPEERNRILADLFMGHRERLGVMVRLRLEPRLRARLATSDVLQDSYVEVQKRLDEYLAGPPMPFYLWLRRVTAQKLLEARRFHLGMQKRAAGREVPIDPGGGLNTTSEALAEAFVSGDPSPSALAARGELKERIAAALDRMDPIDREVIALRHFEHLTGTETAEVLGIGAEAARKRYLRAVKKLRDILTGMPGIRWEL